MAGIGRRASRRHLDIWPGWVDALSSLVMVIVFLLMVFVLSQFALSSLLHGKDEALAQLNSRIALLADQLAMEQADKAKLTADMAALTEQLQASLAKNTQLQADLDAAGKAKDDLAAQVQALTDAAGAKQAELDNEKNVSAQAKAQVDLLNQQLAALRQQLAQLNAALAASEQKDKEQQVQIVDLGKRLNAALAGKVAELARYRSEFFGKLREVLGDRPDIRIVGDRFVFQSEVLFDSGSAELGDRGRKQLASLAKTLLDISKKFPKDLNWILRVDGHTDAVPIHTPAFASNWELSSARATAVVKFLIQQGVAPERLASTGFGEFQPLEPGDTPDVRARNRRIELKLDQR
ncbi:peptidoglycan -binding protein [Nitrospirillum sp. BR 11752]|uniref:peptidoglycan -binding protein n=1 Tax=Nitrospirillum sp. BR 11752 TaxID=3104293 RepID=UPI002EC6AA79|nr:peptidoglycan -binding protein [Nitrospirillum sp. BR 11752]